jgi:phenylalanyl-tRNA synthetase beta chain
MYLPLSWLKDYISLDGLSIEDLARLLTSAGLEVESIQIIGLPLPPSLQDPSARHEFKISGLDWDPDKIIVAEIDEVMPHPNADRLTLCRLNDGQKEYIVLTGAPNLFPYKGQGPLAQPLKVAYAREGSRIYDGHQPGQVLTTLKRTKIRGVESFSMVCSEKELGISEEHEGIMVLDPNAPAGMPLAEYMGDAVFEVKILPNMIRNASVLGIARELSALTGGRLRKPQPKYNAQGADIQGRAAIQITDPDLNPRFVLGLIENVKPGSSPYWVQRRLRLSGMRPINNIVDATNYVMLETGEPLHAFDYDVLLQRAGGRPPTIITRAAKPGEKLITLDGVEHTLDDFNILVCDTAGPLSLAGVMGGMESEVTDRTRNILLEGASWNYINVRRTTFSQRLSSEAGYRFGRGIHPELAAYAVQLGLQRMQEWSAGKIAQGLVDAYPAPAVDPEVQVGPADVRRLLGIELSAAEMARLLSSLEFTCRIEGDQVYAQTPPHRLDIGTGETGKADLIEEIARMVGYANIPPARLADELPEAFSDPLSAFQTRVRAILVNLGLQEVVNYRLTSPEREQRLTAPGQSPAEETYLRVRNPLTPDRSVMRRSLLSSTLEILEANIRLRERLLLFEVGPVFLPKAGQVLPDEPFILALALSGLRQSPAWDQPGGGMLDFFDLKGILEALLDDLHIPAMHYEALENTCYHPGKCAGIRSGESVLGVFGELHPLVKERYAFLNPPVLAAELDLAALLAAVPARREAEIVPAYPPVLEDIAVIVDEEVPAEQVVEVIRQGAGKLLAGVRLFDIFRGEQIGAGKKSLAYNLTYQAPDRTLIDQDAAQIRQRIIKRLDQVLGAKLRS